MIDPRPAIARQLFTQANNYIQSEVDSLVRQGKSPYEAIVYVKRKIGHIIAKKLEAEVKHLGADPSIRISCV